MSHIKQCSINFLFSLNNSIFFPSFALIILWLHDFIIYTYLHFYKLNIVWIVFEQRRKKQTTVDTFRRTEIRKSIRYCFIASWSVIWRLVPVNGARFCIIWRHNIAMLAYFPRRDNVSSTRLGEQKSFGRFPTTEIR